MPRVNHDILQWARETAGLSIDEAAAKLGLRPSKTATASQRLAGLESGESTPSRAMIVRMAKQYRRPLLTFYMSGPPRSAVRGEDFRSLPQRRSGIEPVVDALLRDVRARQAMVRAILQDDEDVEQRPFIGSMQIADGVAAVLASMRRTLRIELSEFRAQRSPEGGFALLRGAAESVGVFVLLAGNLGSHHTAIGIDAFRGFALSDPIAPFIVINDQDAKSAWSFTLLHELAHLWLGATGVSGSYSDTRVEQFCNDVAGNFLLPSAELSLINVDRSTRLDVAAAHISDFAEQRLLSMSMVAYRLFRSGSLTEDSWRTLAGGFRTQWLQSREAQKQRDRARDSGPDYYVVRRHRLGSALLKFVSRNLSEGALTHTKAGKVLGVKPRSVAPLLSGAASSVGHTV